MTAKIFYGLHMSEGVCEYKEKSAEKPYRVLVPENTCKKLDVTFAGKPVFLEHVDEVDPTIVKNEGIGWVSESFFNQLDGKHWAKFIVTDEKGENAIKNGFALSNCYISTKAGIGGVWHGVDYTKEIEEAEYEHLAIVRSPRYKESIILTPDEFKTYNETKKNELEKLKNSQTIGATMLSFFKKEKVSNSDELSKMSVLLPKSQKEVTVEKLINDMDAAVMAQAAPKYAEDDHKVKMENGEEMTLKELKEKYSQMCAAKNSDTDEIKKLEELKKMEELEIQKKKELMNSEDEEKKKNEDAEKKKKEDEEKAKNSENFEKLNNADQKAKPATSPTIVLSSDLVAIGKSKYGSSK